MFDLVRNNKKLVQLFLALIMLPFALWGVDSYVRMGSSTEVAQVGKASISLAEFQQALREQQERLRAQLAGQEELLNSPELRLGVLRELINEKLLAQYASEARLSVSDAALAGFITSVPSLQENGKFSRQRYEAFVAAQGLSVEGFEARVRHDLVLQQPLLAVGNAAYLGHLPVKHWLAAQLETRTVAEALLRAEQFAAQSKPDAAAVKRYYEENRARFEKPELVRVEYLVLSQEKLGESVKISEEELKAYYRSHEARYTQPEQRQASHILIRVDKNASETEVKAAQAKAEELLAQLKKNPADFAKLAKAHSQDPGSAEKGGDLGFFGRGMMVKPFEEAVFGLQEGELSGLVRSDFGFHLIKLQAIRPAQVRPFEEVRAEIAAELKREAAAKRYAEAAEAFANLVYEEPDSLKPAAEKFGLSLQQSDWLAKGGAAQPPFSHSKLRQAIFSEEAIKQRRNTEAINIGNNTLVAARVIEHKPAALEPLEAVAGVIEQALMREAGLARAVAEGQALLERLRRGEKVELAWGAPREVSRLSGQNLPAEARAAIFAAPVKHLPAFAGAKVPGGYALYRIDKVSPYEGGEALAAREQLLRQQYAQIIAQQELASWLAALKERYPVKVNAATLEQKP
ncbi:MAG: SurA N-terminal domain-containing protein [Rhodocyclaceae bacterium]|nr:SurA N-terminal domain-containing protein [Rhodocyclaceae bacterium]